MSHATLCCNTDTPCSCSAGVQIGQVMLTLPHAVALVGLKSAIPLMILYGILSTCDPEPLLGSLPNCNAPLRSVLIPLQPLRPRGGR